METALIERYAPRENDLVEIVDLAYAKDHNFTELGTIGVVTAADSKMGRHTDRDGRVWPYVRVEFDRTQAERPDNEDELAAMGFGPGLWTRPIRLLVPAFALALRGRIEAS
jgi:hypothetical protein